MDGQGRSNETARLNPHSSIRTSRGCSVEPDIHIFTSRVPPFLVHRSYAKPVLEKAFLNVLKFQVPLPRYGMGFLKSRGRPIG